MIEQIYLDMMKKRERTPNGQLNTTHVNEHNKSQKKSQIRVQKTRKKT